MSESERPVRSPQGDAMPQGAIPEDLTGLRGRLASGLVIPACPLALTAERRFDERHQRALIRYYRDAGAGGLAVGVHTTQFAIHDPKVGLYRPLLELAAEELAPTPGPAPVATQRRQERGEAPSPFPGPSPVASPSPVHGGSVDRRGGQGVRPVKVAGLIGSTAQACREAALAVSLGYDCGLLSLAALADADDDALIAHCRAVAEIIPLFGFYLQPAVGGRVLPYSFWRRFAEIERVVAIKIAPFNRYQTLDVVRAVANAGRGDTIALYTGNDDHIVGDLLAEFRFAPTTPASSRRQRGEQPSPPLAGEGQGGEGVSPRGEYGLRMVGGLLGHWAVWTRRAVELLEACKAWSTRTPHPSEQVRWGEGDSLSHLLTLAPQITDCNASLFDAAHGFAGCVAGIHEVLRRQGLLAGRWLLDPHEDLSPGQAEEIDRVCAAYGHLQDDAFVRENLDRWLG